MNVTEKLRVFIGSSSERTADAQRIATWIEHEENIAVRWDDGEVFPAGDYTLASLVKMTQRVQGAIFVFADDDRVEIRNEEGYQPRDNVLIEYGLFTGVLPAGSVVFCRLGKARTARDLDGVMYINAPDGLNNIVREKVGAWLKKLVAERSAGVNREITSSHPLIEIYTDGSNVPRVYALSDDCKRFFGYDPDAGGSNFIGQKAEDLRNGLAEYIDPPPQHWEDLKQDQDMVIEKFRRGKLPLAQVGVRFNEQHPHFPGRTFVPLMVERRRTPKDITKVLYLDIAKLPKHVFGEAIWATVKEGIDLAALAEELNAMADDFIEGAEPRRESLRAAAREAERGGSTKVIELCAEVGLFSMWNLTQGDQRPNARILVKRLLDPLEQEEDTMPG